MEQIVRVLIVEDEVIVAKDMEAILRHLGYAVCGMVRTGEDAVRRAREDLPDLVFMDIGLKGEIDGVEAARQIRATCDIPIVYVTAITDQATFQRAKETDPYGFVSKPFEEKDVRGVVELALHHAKRSRRLSKAHMLMGTAFDCMDEAIVLADSGAEIVYLNTAAEALTGWSRVEAVGASLREVLISAPEQKVGALLDLVPGMSATPFVFTLCARDARQVPVEGMMYPLADRNHLELGYMLRFRAVARTPETRTGPVPPAALSHGEQGGSHGKTVHLAG